MNTLAAFTSGLVFGLGLLVSGMTDPRKVKGFLDVQHLFLGTSETIPVIDGRITLGTWQRVFLVELDHPRLRRVLVNVVGTT